MSEEKSMGIWILFGLVVGVLAEFLTAEHSRQGFVFAILLAIGGAMVGGFLGQLLGFYRPGESVGFLMAVIGSITLLELYTVLIRRRL
jgi:uncharacterized membrane protein YeaQ/YmgE (transglycosylase-associated protein family)